MPKDYKSYSSKKKKKHKTRAKSGGKPILWTVVIILVILFIAALYWLGTHNRKSITKKVTPVQKVLPKKPAPKKNSIKFEFYNMLPGEKVSVPNNNATTSVVKKATANYMVQVASLKNASDADSMKAKLVLDGFNVSVKQNNGWYKVQVGPYSNFDDAFDAQNTLRKNNMDGLIIKLKS